ncbi:fimbrial biogenesis chaperone [Mesorhizobium intechi]|uniref:fimbrial biogenesis chaperone n=1 Tax=Mesorhizobium intechi TaxID=537601 RepID=UPI001FE7715D|nr:fimbria/pilus periplasmic chaperone [Mesorhizobium intechi]
MLVGGLQVRADSLQVQPALVDVVTPGAASTITLRNEGPSPSNVQIRVFRWSQVDGQDSLQPTEDVVASPPAVTLLPGADYVARIVRVAKRPVVAEEAYRLFVDELPDASRVKTGTVKLLVRHSIPVFFGSPDRTPPAVDWTISKQDGRLIVSARNKGGTRLRVSALSLRDAGGHKISFGGGLVGYALGQSTMRWVAPASGRKFVAKGSVSILAQGNDGTINAVAPVVAAP